MKNDITYCKTFKQKYRVPSARANWHDYNGGMYYVTICTKDREHYFGEITDGVMHLSEMGIYAEEQFRNVQQHYLYAKIPSFVVMPNHIHCVVIINNATIEGERRNRWKNKIIDKNMQNVSLHRGKLSTTVGGLKRAISYYAHKNNIDFGWQPRFYDVIIKNDEEMNRIMGYIENNVSNWKFDKLYV